MNIKSFEKEILNNILHIIFKEMQYTENTYLNGRIPYFQTKKFYVTKKDEILSDFLKVQN